MNKQKILRLLPALWGLAIPVAAFLEQRWVVPICIVFVLSFVILRRQELTASLAQTTGRLWMPFTALVVWMGVTVFWAAVPEPALVTVAKFLGNTLMGLLLLSVAADLPISDAKRALYALFISCAGVMVYLAADIASGGDLGFAVFTITFIPIYGFYWFKATAAFLTLAAWPAAYLLEVNGRRGLAIALLLGIAALAYFVGLKAGPFVIISGLVAMALAFRSAKATHRLIAGGGSVLLIAMPLVFGPAKVADFGKSYEPSKIIEYSVIHRLLIWNFVSEKIAEKPLLGWGADASSHVAQGTTLRGSNNRFVGDAIPSHPHNGALQIWLELGLVGATVAVIIYNIVLMRIRRIPDPVQRAFAFGLFCTCIGYWFGSYSAWSSWWQQYLWIAAALMLMAFRLGNRRDEREPTPDVPT